VNDQTLGTVTNEAEVRFNRLVRRAVQTVYCEVTVAASSGHRMPSLIDPPALLSPRVLATGQRESDPRPGFDGARGLLTATSLREQFVPNRPRRCDAAFDGSRTLCSGGSFETDFVSARRWSR
jgi:hypothetical protein